jgi:NHL repeat
MARCVRSNWRLRALRGSLLMVALVLSACDPVVPEGAAVSPTIVFGETGDRPGQFFYPRAMDSDAEGNIWVVDKTARVQGFDARTGEPFAEWRMPNYQKGKPTGITIGPGRDGQEVLYVADTHYHRVMVYSLPTEPGQSEELLGSFGSLGEEPGQFIYPTDVAVLADEETGKPSRIYVSEYGGNDRISVFDADFQFLFAFGSPGDGSAGEIEFNRPQSVEIDTEAGELVVTDSSNHRIGRFTLDGALVAWMGGFGQQAGAFSYPYGLSLLGDGTALVAEFGNHRVQRIDLETGSSRGLYGQPGAGDGQLQNPWGVTTIDRNAYILDSGNNRIIGFRRP